MWGGLIATVAGGIIGALGSKEKQDFSASQAERQEQFQERMSSTAHQREVQDLEAAGLNPMLSLPNYGRGASTPEGARAEGENVGQAGMQSAAQAASIELIEAQVDKTEAEAELHRVEAKKKAGVDTDVATAAAAKMREETKVAAEEVIRVAREAHRLHYAGLLTEEQVAHVRVQIENAFYEGKRIQADTGVKEMDRLLMSLEVPHARNMARAEESAFKREVSPYLRDLGEVTGAARDLGIGAYGARRAGQGLRSRSRTGVQRPSGTPGFNPSSASGWSYNNDPGLR